MLHAILTPQRLTRLGVTALWGAVCLGALGGTVGMLAAGRPPAAAAAARNAGSRCPDGWAEEALRTWLVSGEGTEAALRRFWPDPPSLRGVAPGRRSVTSTATVACDEVRPGWWRVVVVAGVAEGGPPAARYFALPVRASAAGLVALGLPAEVARPPTLVPPTLPYGRSVLREPALADAVAEILAAYLVGDVPLAPLVAPGSRLRPVLPPPYAAVEVRSLVAVAGAGPRRHLLAGVRATDAAGVPWLLDYALSLSLRAGRWEVSSIGGMPAFIERSSDG